ncbi:hypothetical protein SSPO_047540 [Streptomyces antimycoticus]|uniref:Uncharacterized protein n=1 Tax=Streptomyces antimycoticus TaxID=68175 RepID=A0A499V0R4_9ACTN|nr:hypothetical protein SSPO_047540 [Streptomyces antimycoticus]
MGRVSAGHRTRPPGRARRAYPAYPARSWTCVRQPADFGSGRLAGVAGLLPRAGAFLAWEDEEAADVCVPE